MLRCEVRVLPDGRGFVEGVCAEDLPWALSFLRTKCWIERLPLPEKVVTAGELASDLGWSEVTVDALALPLAQVTGRRSVSAEERAQVRAVIEGMRGRRARPRPRI